MAFREDIQPQKTKYFQNCLGVFQGGGCKGVALVGAYSEAVRRGVFFSEVVGASAGAIVAALIGAGASPEQLSSILDRLGYKDLLRPPKKLEIDKPPKLLKLLPNFAHENAREIKLFVEYLGLHDPSYLSEFLNAELQILLNKKEKVKFRDLLIPTTIITTDLQTKSYKIWNSTDTKDDEVGLAVQTSCTIPFFFQPYQNRFVDGGVLSNLPSFVLQPKSLYDKILAFGFQSNKSRKVNSCKDYFLSLVDTTIDGSVDIQLTIQKKIHLIKIDTLDIKSTDFDKMDSKNITFLKNQGQTAVSKFFDNEIANVLDHNNFNKIADDIFQTFNFLISASQEKVQELFISDIDSTFTYSLFPLLLKCTTESSSLNAILKKSSKADEHEQYRRRLLKRLGFNVIEVSELPLRGFIVNGNDSRIASCVILNDINTQAFHSKLYLGEEDKYVINLCRQKLLEQFEESKAALGAIKIVPVDATDLIRCLKEVPQYSGNSIKISVSRVGLEKLTFMTKYVKGYKFRQCSFFHDLFVRNSLDYTATSQIIYGDQNSSIITPAVIEKYGNDFVVIEGNARALFCSKNGFKEINAAVIENVSSPLPSTGRFKLKELLLSDLNLSGRDRYPGYDRNQFRYIEEAVHNPAKMFI